MIDLSAISGLPIALDGERLIFPDEIIVDEAKARRLEELAPVAMTPAACLGRGDAAYWMYNGVYQRKDRGALDGSPLRYDLTLIPPRLIGTEYIKTHGHLHSADAASGLTYPEVYEVLVGTAHFFFQTLDLAGPDAPAAFWIEAQAGDKVLVAPGLDHLAINPGPGLLLVADVMAAGVSNIYERFRVAQGAAYYEVNSGGVPQFVSNPAYRRTAPLGRLMPANYADLYLSTAQPLYSALVHSQGVAWPFLVDPLQFWPMFPEIKRDIESLPE
jgi:glucose-6-phosphate isomerase, archaeal